MSSFDGYLKSIGAQEKYYIRPETGFAFANDDDMYSPSIITYGSPGLSYGQVVSPGSIDNGRYNANQLQRGYQDSNNKFLGYGDLQSDPNMQTAYANYEARQPLLKAQREQAQQQALLAEQQLIQQRRQSEQQNFPSVQSIPQGPGLLQQAPQQQAPQQQAPQSLYRGGAGGGLLGGGLHRGGGQQ